MKDKKDEIIMARVADQCQHNYEPHYFDFMDEALQMKVEPILRKSGEPYAFWGGMEEAGRKMLCIYPDYREEDLQWPMMAATCTADFDLDHRNILGELMALKVVEGDDNVRIHDGRADFCPFDVLPVIDGHQSFLATCTADFDLDHRNILGELMAMGITRECLGDINLEEGQVQIIFIKRMLPFFELNFNKLKGRPVKVTYRDAHHIIPFTPHFKTLELVIASDRVDGLIGKIWGFSRQDALTYIKQKRLRVNYEEVVKNDARVKAGDILSLRGKGKARVVDLGGQTKKGKIRAVVEKYV